MHKKNPNTNLKFKQQTHTKVFIYVQKFKLSITIFNTYLMYY